MLKRVLLSFCAAYTLTACIAEGENSLLNTKFITGQEESHKPMHVIEPVHQNEALRAWWSFLGDPILDNLISTALRLTPERMDIQNGESTSVEKSRADIVAEIVNDYARYRYVQGQSALLQGQIKALRGYLGDENTRNQTKPARIYDKIHQIEQKKKDQDQELASLSARIADLTHSLPEYTKRVLEEYKPLPKSDVLPLLASASASLEDTLEVRAAKTTFIETMQGRINGADITPVFKDVTVGEFFGVPNSVYVNGEASWTLRAGTFAQYISFDKFDKRFGAYNAYQEMQGKVMQIALEYEQKLVTYAHLQEQYITLKNSADKAYENERLLSAYEQQENLSFQSIMKVHDEGLELRQATLKAEYERLKILVDLYVSLGTQ